MLINVNTIMVKGADDGVAAKKQGGKIHYIQLSLINDGKHDLIMPCLEDSIKEKERLKTIINRIRGLNNIDQLHFRIDLRIDEDGNLNYQEQLDDLKSLEFSIGIGIQACCSWKERWDTIWNKWSFSGVIDGLNCEIRKIDLLNAKLNAAVFKDDNIKYIIIPSENRQEAVNWAESEGISLEENIGANIQIADNKRDRSFLSSVWSLATKNTLTQIALVVCLLSITYLPIRYLLWDDVQSLGKDGSHIIINLPIKNPGKTKERLLNYGFLKNQIKDTPLLRLSKRLAKTNQSGRVLITNKNGVIEFEIINPRDWTLISSYICCGYIAVFALVIIIFAIKNDGNTKHNHGNTNYDSILLTDKNKEIMFVDNIKQAEAIVEHKIHCTTEF